MSSEVCPFCGKTYKRLKSHLPHCKVAASSKTPPTKDDVTTTQTTSSPQLVAAPPKTTAKGKKSTQMPPVTTGPQTKKGKNVSSEPLQSTPINTSFSSSSASSTSLPPSTKKKKQKVDDQVKTTPILSSVSPPLPPTVSKPKKKSLRALIEATKSDQVSKGFSPEHLPADSALSSRTTVQTKTNSDKHSVKDDASFALHSADTKPPEVPKKKVSKKKVEQILSNTKRTSDPLDSKVNESSPRPHAKDNFWLDTGGEREDLSVDKLFLKSGNGHQGRITLQDVKATLGRANIPRKTSRSNILSQIETTDILKGKIRLDAGLSPVPPPVENKKDAVSCTVTPVALLDLQHSTTSKGTELQSVRKRASKAKQLALISLQDDAPPQPESASPAAPILAANAQMRQLPVHAVSLSEGLKVGHHITGHLTQFSRPLLPPQTPPVRVEKLQLVAKNQNSAENPIEGALMQRSFGQVRLRELPEWLASRTPTHPRDVVKIVQRSWQWYYRKYIDVKKGGIAGPGMLLVGYCVLSYIWSYPHIKLDRWRKYH